MQEAKRAVDCLVRDSAAVNGAVSTLLHHARRNGLNAAVVLGFLHHKFAVIEDGLAEIVLGQDDPEDEEFVLQAFDQTAN